uniref:NPH3 domain-containing protein n=1 Tax=Medicago truncatula TaxID=3880 RepID=I3T3D3_MEDTR|nr:unknown [Medicago truncatula]
MMDFQKLSREARTHAAQNNRLPAQNVAQILYYEQQRLRDNMDGTGSVGSDSPSTPDKRNVYSSELYPATINSPLLNVSSPSADKPPLPRKSFLNSVSRKLGRLSPFQRAHPVIRPKDRIQLDKIRRYSIS